MVSGTIGRIKGRSAFGLINVRQRPVDDEQCAKCGSVFPADRAWAHHSVSRLMVLGAWSDLDTRVRCPNCDAIFDAVAYRFFGFLSPRAMRRFVATFVLVALCAAVYFLFFLP
jgi:uncharacterized C2H2 Zn-finger protein